MTAVILAAGEGRRLQPLVHSVPKPMAIVCHKPVLEYTLEWMAKLGITNIIITVGYLREAIMNHFNDGRKWGVAIEYSIDNEPMGTAGSLKKAMAKRPQGPFAVWHGDNFSTCNLTRMMKHHHMNRAAATIAVCWRHDVTHSGVIEWTQETRITYFEEKPQRRAPGGWVSAGMYILDPSVLEDIPDGPCDFGKDVFPKMILKGYPLHAYGLSCDELFRWYDTPEELISLRRDFEVVV